MVWVCVKPLQASTFTRAKSIKNVLKTLCVTSLSVFVLELCVSLKFFFNAVIGINDQWTYIALH
ncbi:hypothetical protein D3C79_219580 [compost metagenome]